MGTLAGAAASREVIVLKWPNRKRAKYTGGRKRAKLKCMGTLAGAYGLSTCTASGRQLGQTRLAPRGPYTLNTLKSEI